MDLHWILISIALICASITTELISAEECSTAPGGYYPHTARFLFQQNLLAWWANDNVDDIIIIIHVNVVLLNLKLLPGM